MSKQNLKRVQFRDKVFITVAELLSFSKAAEALFISQPAITKHIKQMEGQLNVALFDRKGSRIYLTDAGKMVYDKLKHIAELYNELEYAVGSLNKEHRGVLKIGASSTIAQYMLPKFLASFYKRYPNIDLNLFNGNSAQMEQMLLNHEIDLALVENRTQTRGLKYFNFAKDSIVAVTKANSLYAKHKTIKTDALKRIPIVTREYGSGTLQILEDAFKSQGLSLDDLKVAVHLGSTEAIKSFLSSFDGLAFVSDQSIQNELQLNKLQVLKVDKMDIDRDLRCVVRQGPEIDLTQKFIQQLLRYNF